MTAPNDILQVVANMSLFGQQVLNVYHVASTGAHDDEDAVGDILVALSDLYLNIDEDLVDDLSFVSVVIKNITADADLGEFDWNDLTTGGQTGDALPTGVAGLITMPTARLKTRGRKFFPGFAEVNTTNGLFAGDAITDLTAAAAYLSSTFLGDFSGDPYAWGVVGSDSLFWPFLSAIVSNIPAYQRRRKQGVGS